ncbi:MAG: hypothetical protein MUQ25_17285, partial [Candidatus Aminicenantes bacterium]|nr:hypothetical protein [Candidatus Aminicenantes bacterium]
MNIGRAAFLTFLTLSAVLIGFAGVRESPQCCSPGLTPSGAQDQEPVFLDLAKSGKKCWIGEVNYFIWEFDKTPKMGTSILIIKFYDRDGKRVTDVAITGQSDMPSMRGAHDSGEVAFKNNRAGDYLLPIN